MIVGMPSQSHGAKMEPSSEHAKSESRSSAENSKNASVLVVMWSGPEWIVVTGGLNGSGARIVQVWTAGVGSGLPEVSIARTSKVCVPTSRISLYGLLQSLHSRLDVLSIRHWNATLLALSVPAKRNVGTSS